MNNLLSYCGLVDAKIRASDKDLPVNNHSTGYQGNNGKNSIKNHPWKHKFGGFLTNSMKQQSMNQNANQVRD